MKKSYFAKDFSLTRNDVVSKAAFDCLNDMYKSAYPSITWEEYENLHKGLPKAEAEKKNFYNAYYLPEKVYLEIKDSYAEAYDLKSNLPSTIEILKGYFKKPIVTAYKKDKDGNSYKGYDHPEPMDDKSYEVACKYLDMADGFYNWNMYYNAFCFTVMNYSPTSNRETVERWWHDNGHPEFKLPDESYWEYDDDDYDDENENNENKTEVKDE